MPDSPNGARNVKIDILIPAIEKDLATLPHVIASARAYVRHPIGRIIVVAPQKKAIRELCRRLGVVFVDERKALPITKKDINYHPNKGNRSGWLYQQLLKWCGDGLCRSRYYLVMDADTVLLRPHSFTQGKERIFYSRNWSHEQYYRAYRKLLGEKAGAPSSFVSHYMLLDREKVRAIKRKLESRHGVSWYRAIIQGIDKTRLYAYSEFETYGNYLYARSPGRVCFRKALNKEMTGSFAALTPDKRRRLAARYRSLSFHKRKDYFRKKPGV